MPSRQAELEELIREQRKENTSFQFPEQNTVSLSTLEGFLSNDGLSDAPKQYKRSPECVKEGHGKRYIIVATGWTGWRCSKCRDQATERWRKNNPERSRQNRRNSYLRQKQDPEWMERYRARKRREWQERKKRAKAS